jgi:hemerythrin
MLDLKEFEWSDDFSVGVKEMDEQHKKLFLLVGRLHKAIKNKEGNKPCSDILNELVEYTQTHFSLEETMMRIGLFPEYKAHCAQHKALVDEVAALQQKIASGQASIGFELLHFLRTWLTKHILREDMQYGEFFSQREQRLQRIENEGVDESIEASPEKSRGGRQAFPEKWTHQGEEASEAADPEEKKSQWWKFW